MAKRKFLVDVEIDGKISATNIVNNTNYDGTGTNIPKVDAVNELANNIARALTATGFIDTTDSFVLSRVDDFTLGIGASQFGIVFSQRLKTPPFVPSDAVKHLTARNVPLSAIGLTGTGTAIKFVGYRGADDTIVFSDTQYIQSPAVCQLGIVLVKYDAGVTSFIDTLRTTITIPDVAAYSNLETASTKVKASANISAIAGTLSHSNSTGELVGISVAWGTSNNDIRPIPSSGVAATAFTRLHPGNALSITPPAVFTVLEPTQSWNGTALTPIPGNPNQASVQRLLFTVRGNFVWQYGEKIYTNLVAAQNNILQAPFTNILPEGTFAEIGRMAITVGCTDLNSSLAQYYPTGAGGGGGTSPVSPTAWGFISGSIDDQLDLKARLDAKAPLASPALTGVPTAPTAPATTSTTQIATTAFLQGAIVAFLPLRASDFKTDYVPESLCDGVRKSFNTDFNFVTNSTKVYLNGLRLRNSIDYDYTESGNSAILFSEAPLPQDLLTFDYIKL